MGTRSEAMEQYLQALRSGQRYYNDAIARGEYPYPQVLEEIVNESQAGERVSIGTVEIPMRSIVGTMAAGRKAAFAGNFMPLLGPESEFASKWVNLCEAHLGTTGITDPIKCLEYMGRFYVQEGHTRVSVLRSYGAPSITGTVTRIIPAWADTEPVRAYYEFMKFYRLAGIYQVIFRRTGCYDRLQAALGHEPDHVWTPEERADFLGLYWKMQEVCDARILTVVRHQSVSETLLACLEVYPYAELRDLAAPELRKRVTAILPDLRFDAAEEPTSVSTEPTAGGGKSIVSRIIDGLTRSELRVAFVHAADPEHSGWTRGHELGRAYLEEQLAGQVRTAAYTVGSLQPIDVMKQAVEEGAQVLIATAPTLLGAARQIAALHPELKVLVCALSVPFVGIRTYYSRIYEAKFISGAIAGALSGGAPIGYIARYPILGEPTAINAFALGARMTCPQAVVQLEWSCLEGNALSRLMDAGARIISGHPVGALDDAEDSVGWTTSLLAADGTIHPLASDVWYWGRLYVQIVSSVLGGAWTAVDPSRLSPVSYWWGMNSGVIDVRLAADLPAGVRHLAEILRRGVTDGSIQPFGSPVRDQAGKLRFSGEERPGIDELMRINWLCDSVIGRIPEYDELLPMSKETTRLLALPKDKPAEPAPAEEEAPAEKGEGE